MRNLDHPNILKLYEFFEDEQNFFIITEFCEGKDLFEEIISRGRNGTLTELEAVDII